jgi:hypothetical protein
LDFVPPLGDVLLPGLTYSQARRAEPMAQYPWVESSDTDPSAGLHVTQWQDQCDTVTGSFSIHALRLDENGRVMELAATFEQYCNGSSAALRGRVDVRTEW